MKVTCALLFGVLIGSSLYAEPLTCDMKAYKPLVGLSATAAVDRLTVIWDAERGEALRLQFVVTGGAPTIQELAVRKGGGPWRRLAANVAPAFGGVHGSRLVINHEVA